MTSTLSLRQQMDGIRNGTLTQFFSPVQIPASALVPGIETPIYIGGLASTIWLPPTWIRGDYTIQVNPPALVFGVRINLATAPILPWGLQGNNVASFSGPVEKIFVTLLSGTVAPVTLMAARGIGLGYSGALTAAGTPPTAPTFGGGGHNY